MNQLPPPPPVPHGPAGNARLYLPHRFFAGQPTSFQPGDSPMVAPGQPPIFPLPAPLPGWVPTGLHLNPLQIAEHTTNPDSQTKTATQIENLQNTDRGLRHIQTCRSFFANLLHYARHPGVQQGGAAPAANTTWTLPLAQHIPLPRADQQLEGIIALASWYIYHTNRTPVMSKVNSEPSIHVEFFSQAIEPMNGLLKTRYPQLAPGPSNTTYPRWGRACDALHRTPGVRRNAGYPDFLLIRSAALHDNGVTAEIKDWWSYDDAEFINLFNNSKTFIPGTDSLVPRSRTTMAKLLKQIWGQLYFFECHLGVCTNGHLVMFFAKSGADTLILSPLIQWNDPGVHEALAGLSFAGVDIRHAGANMIIEQILCPLADRVPGSW